MLSLLLKMLHVILPFMFGPILAALLCVKVLKLKNTMAILVESNWFNTTWSSNWLYLHTTSD